MGTSIRTNSAASKAVKIICTVQASSNVVEADVSVTSPRKRFIVIIKKNRNKESEKTTVSFASQHQMQMIPQPPYRLKKKLGSDTS